MSNEPEQTTADLRVEDHFLVTTNYTGGSVDLVEWEVVSAGAKQVRARKIRSQTTNPDGSVVKFGADLTRRGRETAIFYRSTRPAIEILERGV